jgi:hypothetical protein
MLTGRLQGLMPSRLAQPPATTMWHLATGSSPAQQRALPKMAGKGLSGLPPALK